MTARGHSSPDRNKTKSTEIQHDTSKSLLTQQRRAQILDIVARQGVARVGELAERFGVSEVTIRSDLSKLDHDGVLVRDHGGAIAKPQSGRVTSLLRVDERSALHLDEKRRIGMAAAEMVSPGETIILDAGTTVVEMVRLLGKVAPLTVVTNALNVALELGSVGEADILLLGGAMSRRAASTMGPLAERALQEISVKKVFLGTQAMDVEHGLTDSTPEIAQVKRMMIRSAQEVILLTDSSKWGRSGFINVAQLAEVDTMITDTGLPAEACVAIERLGVRLILV